MIASLAGLLLIVGAAEPQCVPPKAPRQITVALSVCEKKRPKKPHRDIWST